MKIFKNFSLKLCLGFSLVELMVSLVVISIIAAAFVPVVTKKLQSSEITILSGGEISTQCSDFGSDCALCNKNKCIQCNIKSCSISNQYVDVASCSCKFCEENCLSCENNICKKCADGFYIENGKCLACPSDKICDGEIAHDKEYCNNPAKGYYCDGDKLKKCVDKFGSLCSVCTSQKCTTCSWGYFGTATGCEICQDGCGVCTSKNDCQQCHAHTYRNSSGKCLLLCKDKTPNCTRCNDDGICHECGSGYVLNSDKKCTSCSELDSNCKACVSNNCTICKSGYYPKGKNCIKCNVQNCAMCATDGTCASCNSGYVPSEDNKSCEQKTNVFACSDSNFMKIGNLCVTRVSMGDISMLPIPSDISIARANSDYCYSSSQKCCWKGGKPESCDAPYPSCERTFCNFEAAKEICESFNFAGKTWRLPTYSEIESFVGYTYNLGTNGLMLCGTMGYNYSYIRCYGAAQSLCVSDGIYYSDSSLRRITVIGLNGDYSGPYYGAQVRCVTEME